MGHQTLFIKVVTEKQEEIRLLFALVREAYSGLDIPRPSGILTENGTHNWEL